MDEVNVEEGFKRCSRCGQVKPLSEFNKKKGGKYGRCSICKECTKAYNAEYYQDHKDKIAAYYAEYRANNKESIAQKQAEYRANNKEAIAQKKAQYYQEHKDERKAYNAEYYDQQKNPLGWAKMMVHNYRKMDRERGFDTSQTISAEWFLQNIAYRPCVHCGLQAIGLIGCNRLDNTKGHIPSNCEPCCFKCNLKENVRDQIARGLHWTCKHKKQSFSSFVEEHKAKNKNLT